MQKLLYGMVGGGPGAMIGKAHRAAIRLDGLAELSAGCFSSSPETSFRFGREMGINPDRCYANYREMAAREAVRSDKIDFVVVVTPNDSHFEICRTFLEAGFHVVCDKPLSTTLEQAKALRDLAKARGLLFMVTYTYTGHVTFKYMRDLIRMGVIGHVRTVMAEYPQGWLHDEKDKGGKQGTWRMNPAHAGRVNCLGDLGTHVENAVSRATGLRIKRLLARLDTVVPGRVLDDNDQILVEYNNGATGVYWTSQIAVGCENGLRLRIFGSKGSLFWFQENPEELIVCEESGSMRVVRRGQPDVTREAAAYGRMPAGHPEGWTEAMANLYKSFAGCVQAKKSGNFSQEMIDYPTVSDGVSGIAFIETCLESQKNGSVWVEWRGEN